MDKIDQIFNLINGLLVKLGLLLKQKAFPCIPKTLISFFTKLKNIIFSPFRWLESMGKKGKKRVQESFLKSFSYIKSDEFKGKIDKIKTTTSTFAKENIHKGSFALLTAFLLNKVSAFKAWLAALSPKVILSSIVFTSVMGVCSLKVFYSGKRIYNKSYQKPAKQEEKLAGRPAYYKQDKRQTLLYDITLPIHIETKKNSSQLYCDIVLEFSNRNLVLYLQKNVEEFKGYINTKLKPFPENFPFTIEGKRIIKQKIKDELNKFIELKHVHNKDIEGRVNTVYIQRILAG